MLPLLIAMGVPLFVMIGYALLQPDPAIAQAADKEREHLMEDVALSLF